MATFSGIYTIGNPLLTASFENSMADFLLGVAQNSSLNTPEGYGFPGQPGEGDWGNGASAVCPPWAVVVCRTGAPSRMRVSCLRMPQKEANSATSTSTLMNVLLAVVVGTLLMFHYGQSVYPGTAIGAVRRLGRASASGPEPRSWAS